MNQEENEYCIKVPVFTSKVTVEETNVLGEPTQQKLIEGLLKKLENYTANPFPITMGRKNKTIKRGVDSIEPIVKNILPDTPALLLKIKAHNTNTTDRYIQGDTNIKLKPEDKIGIENNIVVLYPHIIDLNDFQKKYHWIVMVYEDPNKDNNELVSTAKAVLDKVLGIPVRNIKLKEVIDTLKEEEVARSIVLKFSTLTFNEFSTEPEFKSYFQAGNTKTEVEQIFNDVPYEEVEKMLNLPDKIKKWVKINYKIFSKNKEYRITKSRTNTEAVKDAKTKTKELIESIFNASCPLEKSELDKIYNIDFIISKLGPVLVSYITNTDESPAVLK